MKKKYVNVIIIGIMSFLLVGTVCATTITIVPESYSWWDNFLYTLQEMGLFTAAGQSRQCDTYAKLEINPAQGDYYSSDLVSQAGCSRGYALFNIFDLSWNFLSEYRSEDVGILRKTSPGIIEVYCCPYEACDLDSDCEDPWGNTCNSIYGSCYYTAPAHSTKVYKCVSGNWVYQGIDYYGGSNWCSDSNHNNYVREGQTIGGCYPIPPIGWCVVPCASEGESCGYSATAPECCAGLDCQNFQCVPTGECSSEETKCGIVGDPFTSGQVYYICVDGTFKSQGLVDGECGYVPTPLICSTIKDQSDCEANNCLWEVSLFGFKAECVDKNGNDVCIEGQEKCVGTGETSNDVVFCTDGKWGIPGGIGWANCISGTICNVGDIGTNICYTPSGVICDGDLKCEPEQGETPITCPIDCCIAGTDTCNYGTNEYFICVDGEWENQGQVAGRCGYGNGNGVIPSKSSTITWTEFYSIDDDKFSQKDYSCTLTKDCPLKEGYNVSCSDDEIFKERTFKIYKDACDKGAGFIDEIIYGSLYLGSWGLFKADICSWIAKGQVFYDDKTKGAGTCLAESNTFYGKLWETALKTVGGMGLPAQYVMIITLMILITLIGLGVRMLK